MNTHESREQWEGSITALAPVVMVAGPFGSGMEELAMLLAKQLGVPFYDPHKLDALASDREAHDGAWEHLRQGVESFFEYWVSHLHEKPGMSRSEHLIYLTAIMRQVAREGGVIAGVCTHMILGGEKLFRIEVKAGPEFCARRLAEARGGDWQEAITVFHHMEEERRLFMHKLFEEAYAEPIPFDLVLDAETMSRDTMLEACLMALGGRGMLERAA